MNDFLNHDNRLDPRPIPNRIYARVDDAEPLDRGVFRFVLDGVDADWFDNTPGADKDTVASYFEAAPLATIEASIRRSDERAYFGQGWTEKLPQGDGAWFEIQTTSPWNGVPASAYTNLHGPALPAWMRVPFKSPKPEVQTRLNSTFSLDGEPEADKDKLEDVLSPAAHSVGSLVVDVGQGNCNALIDGQGRPTAYFDFGAGVRSHAGTFPLALQTFCFCHAPPIILSHWDQDHWAGANIDRNALQHYWIVPRQTLGASHRVFAQQLIGNGRLLIWPANLPSLAMLGHLQIERCTGNGRNHSGLATVVQGRDASGNKRTALLPGDARYNAIPSHAVSAFTHVVSPHHGANMRNRWTPLPQSQTHCRLVHSYGAPNSYRHPHLLTRQQHNATGWFDALINPLVPSLVRETTMRTGGFGHVFLPWDPTTGIPTLTCCGLQTLTATQT